MFQSLYHFYCPVLDTLQYFCVSLVLQSTDLYPAPQMCLTGAELNQRITSLSLLASVQHEAVGFLCHKDMLLAHIQFGAHQKPQGPFVPSCSPARQSLVCTDACSCVSWGMGGLSLLVLNSVRFLFVPFSSLSL